MTTTKNPFAVDWTDLNAVIAYAKRLGSRLTVYGQPDRENYNVCHTSREVATGVLTTWVKYRT